MVQHAQPYMMTIPARYLLYMFTLQSPCMESLHKNLAQGELHLCMTLQEDGLVLYRGACCRGGCHCTEDKLE